MKKVIIYGLGNGRLEAEKAIASDCEIIAYTDGIAKINTYDGKPFLTIKKIQDAEYDYIIITITNPTGRNQVRRTLIEEYGIKSEKIILFYEYMEHLTKADRVMNGKDNQIEGIILGMSTAECGILSEKLHAGFCNLAISSQDIFYNYKTIKYVIDNYKNLNLKYLLIDMYDYRWFNFDLSLSKSIGEYLCDWHGLRYEIHNLERNANLQPDDISRIKKVSEYRHKRNDFEILKFGDYYGDSVANGREKWIEDRDYTEKDIHPRLIDPKVRLETIRENKILFEYLLAEVKEKFPSVKIKMLLLPRYITMNQILDKYHGSWKNEFQTIIRHYIEKYGVEFLNYRNYLPICENPYFFYDLEHLNYAGATAFSSLLNQEIQWD